MYDACNGKWNAEFLRPWHFRCQRLLPIEIPESLTTQEQLCKAWFYINSLIEDVQNIENELENLPQTIAEEVAKQTDALQKELLQRMTALEQEMRNLQTEILNEVDSKNLELKQYVDIEVAKVQSMISDALSDINALIAKVNTDMDNLEVSINTKITDLQIQINDIKDSLAGKEGFLKNPMTGETGGQNEVFASVYDWLREPHTLTCGEIAASDITYQKIRDTELSCGEVSVHNDKWDMPRLYNPVTGEKTYLQNIFNAMWESEQQLPNWRYDQLNITNEDIVNSGITYETFRQNQNILDIEELKVYARFADNTWLGTLNVDVPATEYSKSNAFVTVPLRTTAVIDKIWNLDCTATDNGGNVYHITEPYYEGGFKCVVPEGLYGKLLTLSFRAVCTAQEGS